MFRVVAVVADVVVWTFLQFVRRIIRARNVVVVVERARVILASSTRYVNRLREILKFYVPTSISNGTRSDIRFRERAHKFRIVCRGS